MRSFRCIFKVAMLASLLAAAGCWSGRPGESPSLWAADELVDVSPAGGAAPVTGVYDPAARRARLMAGAGQTVSLQVVVDCPDGGRDLRLDWSELSDGRGGSIDPTAVRAWRAIALKIDRYPPWAAILRDERPSATFDPLVPLDAPDLEPLNVQPGGRAVFWLDVTPPAGTAAGRYRSSLRVSSSNLRPAVMELSLDVRDYTLPGSGPRAAGGFDHRQVFETMVRRDNGQPFRPLGLNSRHPLVRQGLTAVRNLALLGREHRLDLFDAGLRPLLKRADDGQPVLDWSEYDNVATPYLQGSAFGGGRGVAAWPMPLGLDWPDPVNYGGPDSEQYQTLVRQLGRMCSQHFEQLGYAGGFYNLAGGDSSARRALVAALAEADPDAMVLRDGQAPRRTNNPLYAPPAWGFDRIRAASEPRAWLRPTHSPHLPGLGLVDGPADPAACAWFADGCELLLIDRAIDWSSDAGTQFVAGPQLFYPGSVAGREGEVLPGIRLKRLRNGLQDLALLEMLRAGGRGDAAQRALRLMTWRCGSDAFEGHLLQAGPTGWARQPRHWRIMRQILAREVEAAFNGSAIRSDELAAQRLAWMQLAEALEAPQLEVLGSRVVPGPGKSEWRVAVRLFNPSSEPADVTLSLAALPGGFEAHPLSIRLPGGADASTRTVDAEVLAAGPLAFPDGGVVTARLDWSAGGREMPSRPLRVPLARIATTTRPPDIDGRLGDWAPRAGNTLSQFVTLGPAGQRGLAAALSTRCSLLDDGENLYIAIVCHEPGGRTRGDLLTNRVQYDRLVACGEDLVEIVLDPGADARSPADLLHLVVKSNGAVTSTRGIEPLGSAQPWASGATAAVGKAAGAWVVELAIPRASLGPGAAKAAWGLNVARFVAAEGQSSSWAGASRSYYLPASLGTVLPDPAEQQR
jgi:hypothetical protein